MATDLIEAVRSQLATYLQAQLVGTYATLKTFQEWPTPGKPLPEYAIAILATAQPDVRFHAPVVRKVTPGVAPAGTVRYSYARATIDLQLDAWARFAATRDALAASVRDAVNRHPIDSLGLTGQLPHFARRGGLVLKLSSLLDAPCEYRFDVSAAPQESGPPTQEGEWRATWMGRAVTVMQTEEQLALLTQLTLQVAVNGGTENTVLTP